MTIGNSDRKPDPFFGVLATAGATATGLVTLIAANYTVGAASHGDGKVAMAAGMLTASLANTTYDLQKFAARHITTDPVPPGAVAAVGSSILGACVLANLDSLPPLEGPVFGIMASSLMYSGCKLIGTVNQYAK